jgi:hypothetical protein
MKGLTITTDLYDFGISGRADHELTLVVCFDGSNYQHFYLRPEQVRALCTWAYLRVGELEEAGFLDEGELAVEQEAK